MDQQPTLLTSSTLYLLLFIGLTLIASPLAHSQNNRTFVLPPNHQSIYQLEKYETNVGELKNTLNYHEDTIRYTSIATAKGVASLLIDSKPKEVSVLNWPEEAKNTLPKLLSYEYFQDKNHKKNQKMHFSYNDEGETHIKGSYKHKSYTLNTQKTIWNRQFLPLLMSSDLSINPQRTRNTFYLTDKGKILEYTYTWQANETLKLNNKKQNVLKFKITWHNKKRETLVWLSKNHYYLPLKIEQYKEGELNARMTLTKLKLNNHE